MADLEEIQRTYMAGIRIVAVGITKNVSCNVLSKLATESNFISIPDFASLSDHELAQNITDTVCKLPPKTAKGISKGKYFLVHYVLFTV